MFRLEPGQQMIGRELGHYLILKKFRADAMVEVYLAQDTAGVPACDRSDKAPL